MPSEEKIAAVKNDGEEREAFIRENISFIKKTASKSAGQFIDESDDVFSEALIAFNDAIDSFVPGRGGFAAFAKTVIKNRITDYFRKEKGCVIPFSALAVEDDSGDETEFEVEDKKAGISETAIEINSLKNELDSFGIDFFSLADSSPKAGKTREQCLFAIKEIAKNDGLSSYLYKKKAIPASQVGSVNKKILERHRKYIIAGVLTVRGGYDIIGGYFGLKGVLEQ